MSERGDLLPIGGPQASEFPVWPYLDTLYRWIETQPWFEAAFASAWEGFRPAPDLPLPDPKDPDGIDRSLRFWAYFALDHELAPGDRPIDRFLGSEGAALTPEGRAAYEALATTVYGAFKVSRVVPGRLVTLEALAGTERYRVIDPAFAAELQVGDLVVGRLYAHEDAFWPDPDVVIGHLSEAPERDFSGVDARWAEKRYFQTLVSPKGHVLDVIDALLMRVDSPLLADEVAALVPESESLEQLVNELYASPGFRLRYLSMRDRGLLDEVLRELWETSAPLERAELEPEAAEALSRTVAQALQAIAHGDAEALRALADPDGCVPIYLDWFGLAGLKKLTDTDEQAPGLGAVTRHQLLPKDGGIFTTVKWQKGKDKFVAGVSAHATPDGHWLITDFSPPDDAPGQLVSRYDQAKKYMGTKPTTADVVEAFLWGAVREVGYAVHDAVDLVKIWREFKALAAPDLAQPAIWAAGVELADARYRNEDPDVKVLAKAYRVLPHAITQAADRIQEVLRAKDEAEES